MNRRACSGGDIARGYRVAGTGEVDDQALTVELHRQVDVRMLEIETEGVPGRGEIEDDLHHAIAEADGLAGEKPAAVDRVLAKCQDSFDRRRQERSVPSRRRRGSVIAVGKSASLDTSVQLASQAMPTGPDRSTKAWKA